MKNNQVMLAGVDEVGRGPLAGPVIAAAVILDETQPPIVGLADSKTLTAKRRELLAEQIRERALAYALGRAEVTEIDELNILQASLLAMQRAVAQLTVVPDKALVDGNHCPRLICPATAIIRGDKLIPVISAASILAKVVRDAEMNEWDKVYPGYGLATHKGYPTAAHKEALKRLGVTPLHRRTFAPVRACLEISNSPLSLRETN